MGNVNSNIVWIIDFDSIGSLISLSAVSHISEKMGNVNHNITWAGSRD